ncbi:hypothetical protein SAMN07250955_11661 [Arboricoccus pini]|uniref:Zinc-ribbon domain-containing protein n=1 Tax=Arboricoccus pini TaxID=1963835 RepID=A0A212RX95_9PROT|nr:putative zinc-binding peptidase [Arboricoccus pini]SNB77325.1 hypothetical protein SAMN07250955_11661 [Arboricoccus pini]
MKLFKCQHCGQTLFFENTLCEKCGHKLGYLPDLGEMSAVEPDGANWIALANKSPESRYRFCANWELQGCNWMVPLEGDSPLCLACQHNQTIPDLSNADFHGRWQNLEAAKRRLMYSVLKLNLPRPTPGSGDPEPLVFDFLADPPDPSAPKVMTGHDNGLITISLTEADDAEREALRAQMNEPYRTLLGHFRHEVGHYYWDKLVRDRNDLEACRAIFGDDTQDYGQAIQRHYNEGAPPDWQNSFVSSYATMHPWEDFAETWAHYLHIVDTLEMASAFGISIAPDAMDVETEIDFDPHKVRRVETLIDAWLPLTYAVNSLNRAMGLQDLYPFVLSPPVITKLGYIHKIVHTPAGTTG